MKIIAIIPKDRDAGTGLKYIAEVEAAEVINLTMLGSVYAEIPVINDGVKNVRKVDELQIGDYIDPKETDQRRVAFAEYINARKEIEKAMASLRGAMTKLQNITTPSEIPS